MEVPTRKEVVDKLEWRSSDVVEVGSGHNLDATYEWESVKWTADIHVWEDERYFDWKLNRNSSDRAGGQCKNLEDAIFACVDAILDQIKKRVADYQREQKEARELGEYNQKGKEWADKANSVTIED